MKTILLRFLLALSTLFGAGQALANPAYHVTVDTTSLAGQGGYIDFLMLSLANATPVAATINHFSGDFGAASYLSGDAAGTLANGIFIGNANGFGNFGQWASFGGVFNFDVTFASSGAPGPGTNLGISLLDASWNYLGAAGDIVTLVLQPGSADVVHTDAGLAAVSVTEPSTLALMAPLLMLVWLSRRNKRSLDT